MKHVLLTFVMLMALIKANSQSNATISGQVISTETKETVPYAMVAVRTLENDIVNGGITLEDGSFVINGVDKGKYLVSVSCLGYEQYEVEILVGELNQHYDIGKIQLANSDTELNEVIVSGNRLNGQPEEKIYDMRDNIAQSGGTVMDAMKAMPGVTFSQDGKLVLRGSDKVIVLMDGKQSSLTGFGNQKGLDNIPAANIERIEIINNPSAKYDARGMAGIVNIIYKKDKQKGLHGDVGFAYGLGALAKRRADLPTELGSFSPTPKYIPSVDLHYEREKIGMFLQSEVLFQQKLPNNEFTTRNYNDGRVIVSQVPENRVQDHYILKAGMDYRLNDNNIITFSGIYDWENHVDTAQVVYLNELDGSRNRYITWNEEEITGYMNFTTQYEHKFRQAGHTLHASLLYAKGWEDETYYINDSSALRANGREVTNILATEHTSSIMVDYVKPLKAGRVEAGSKFQLRYLPVEYTQQRGVNSILFDGLGNWTKWGESIYAVYGNWVRERDNHDIEAGLRTEYTTVYYDMDTANAYYKQDDTYDYLKLFPMVRVGYKVNERNKISLYFNQRVDRPGEPELRMYAKSDDHELIKVGNPYLRPQYTRSMEVAYKTSWNNGSMMVSLYHRAIQDPYMRLYARDTTQTDYDVVLKIYANTGEAANDGVEVIFNQAISDFWKLSGNINYYRNKIFGYAGKLLFPYEHAYTIDETTDNTWDIKLINTFTLLKDMQIQLTGLYMAPKNIPQGRQLSRSSIDVGLNKKLWKGKAEITLSATDIFNKYGIRQNVKGEGFDALYENYYETQVVRLGLKYRF